MAELKKEETPDEQQVITYAKGYKIGPLTIPAFRTPIAQVILTGVVCFLCPGMFNALSGMGGGGQIDPTISAKANTALYTTFAVIGFTAGTFLNILGASLTLALGGIGYAVYVASFLSYNHTKNEGFVVFAGALLGWCAAFLWTAQGTVMMSYPTEDEKGKYIGIFWAIFNTGAVLGSLIPIGTNWNVKEPGPVVDGTYVGFFVLMLTGAVLANFLVKPSRIVRKDGTRVQKVHHPSFISEMKGLYETLLQDPYIILLFPFFWASNWFYTYQFNAYNLHLFTPRSRAFTGLFYWLAQIVGAVSFGAFLDTKRFTRRKRATWGWGFLFVLVNVVWGGGLAADLKFDRPPKGEEADLSWGLDVVNSPERFPGYFILYIFYGLMDSMWQTYAYWVMGALSNDPRRLAYFAGFYKGIQSAGAAVAWGIDSDRVAWNALFGSSWGLCVAGLVFSIPVVWWRVKDTEITEDDLIVAPSQKTDPVAAPVDAEVAAIVRTELEAPAVVEKTESAVPAEKE